MEKELHSACRTGDLFKIESILESDLSIVNSMDAALKWTPLFRSVVSTQLKAVEVLLIKGANPNLANLNSETPLHEACSNSLYSIASLLLKYEADPNAQDEEGNTSLHVSANDSVMLELLLKYKADPNIENSSSQLALHLSVEADNEEAVRILLLHGSESATIDSSGRSPLELASPHIRQIFDAFSEKTESSQIEITTFEITQRINSVPELNCEFSMTGEKFSLSPVNIRRGKLHYWLEKMGLERYFERFVSEGYDDLNEMIEEMRTSLPISTEELESLGIERPGDRYRILITLDEEAGIGEPIRYRNLYVKNSWQCDCSKEKYTPVNSLRWWLELGNLAEIEEDLDKAGYDVELVLVEAESGYRFTEGILKHELRIFSPAMRSRFLRFLQETLRNPMFLLTSGPIDTSSQYSKCVLM